MMPTQLSQTQPILPIGIQMVVDCSLLTLRLILLDGLTATIFTEGDPLTGVQVELPDTFNGSNSAVFIYYSNLNSVASLWDSDEDGVFDLGSTYATPIGQNISFVVISEINGSFYFTIVNATIVNGHYEIISSTDMMGPVPSTDILNAINAL